jgi:hypothetical protein
MHAAANPRSTTKVATHGVGHSTATDVGHSTATEMGAAAAHGMWRPAATAAATLSRRRIGSADQNGGQNDNCKGFELRHGTLECPRRVRALMRAT